jgi:hypothetical protein
VGGIGRLFSLKLDASFIILLCVIYRGRLCIFPSRGTSSWAWDWFVIPAGHQFWSYVSFSLLAVSLCHRSCVFPCGCVECQGSGCCWLASIRGLFIARKGRYIAEFGAAKLFHSVSAAIITWAVPSINSCGQFGTFPFGCVCNLKFQVSYLSHSLHR